MRNQDQLANQNLANQIVALPKYENVFRQPLAFASLPVDTLCTVKGFRKHSMNRIAFCCYGGKLSGPLHIHFLNKLKADLFA